MSKMVDKVAHALSSEIQEDLDFDKLARLVIEAMREPTDAMKQIGAEEGQWAEGMPSSDEAEQRWRESAARGVWASMIESALK